LALIRTAGATDTATLLPLVAAYWEFESISGFDPACVAPQLERLLSTPSLGAGWIAVSDNIAVGYLLAVYVFSLEHMGITAEIDEFFVMPAGRASGVGSELLRTAETEFMRMGCTNVSLQLSRGNDSARQFYRRFGYAERSGFELLDKVLHSS
jgi:GNAT superfamily N-acetyltransferase